MSTIQQKVADYLAQNPQAITLEIASQLQLPEGDVLANLPPQFVRVFPGSQTQQILESISQWGTFTTIVEKEGCIFEVKDQFPLGTMGRGYYNLNMKGDQGALCGHLKLEQVREIAFVSLPFRGKESYNIAFIAHNGNTIFKVYLGRDEQHQLFPDQIEKFKAFIA